MLRRMLLTALVSGVAAGVLVTLVQQVRVAPLILEAETYEQRGGADTPARAEPADPADRGQDGGPARLLLTAVSNMLAGTGFGLLLAAGYALHGRHVTPGRGVLWGLAGYAVFIGAPALGLPPELPGAPAAALQARQLWWLGAAAATATGLAMIFIADRLWLDLAGGFLLVLPHALGAPHPASAATAPFPPDMATQFIIASLATSLVFWLFLGGVSGWIYRRLD